MTIAKAVTAPALDGLSGIRHGFFTRHGGVSSGLYASLNAGLGSQDQRDHVIENRRRMCDVLAVGHDDLATPYQVHSSIAVTTDQAWQADRPQADGVVVTRAGLAAGIVTADCGPVLFADPDARVVAAAHAGWKGALTGVLEATINEMEQRGASRDNITAVLGPSISQASYEVGPEFPKPFLTADAANSRFFEPGNRDGHWQFDLAAYIVERLRKAGVNGSALNICTFADEDNYFSYRRTTHRGEGDYGRQLSAIVLV